MTKDLADYLAEQLRDMRPFFRWKVVNNAPKRIVELYITFRVDLDERVYVQDDQGRINGDKYIQFEDVIAFYDAVISNIQLSHYLTTIPMDNTKGIAKGEVTSFLKQLMRVVSSGKNDLDDFLSDSILNTFELRWNQANYHQTIKTLQETNRYSKQRVHMNFEKGESLIDKLKGERVVDGVERI